MRLEASAIIPRVMSADTATAPPGLRERKKQQTRRHIAQAARRLFTERGFEAVTVADVARAADVAQKTVFNYFATKEDLFYDGWSPSRSACSTRSATARPGETVLAAFRAFVLAPEGVFAMKAPARGTRRRAPAAITRMIAESPALLAREREVLARYSDSPRGADRRGDRRRPRRRRAVRRRPRPARRAPLAADRVRAPPGGRGRGRPRRRGRAVRPGRGRARPASRRAWAATPSALSGISARRRVPRPTGLSTATVPSSAARRSFSPRRPEPRAASPRRPRRR